MSQGQICFQSVLAESVEGNAVARHWDSVNHIAQDRNWLPVRLRARDVNA